MLTMLARSPAAVPILAACLVLAAGAASAATLAPINVADITRVDELGFACIEETDLEAAYSATGKKDGLLPQTCLPKPCVRQVGPDELAQHIGRDPTEVEWSDYVSRYAENCVAETAGPWPEDVMFANASAPVTDDTFWDGLAGVPLNSGVGSDVIGSTLPGGTGSFTGGLVVPIVGGIAGLPSLRSGSRGVPTSGPVLGGFPGFIGGDDDSDENPRNPQPNPTPFQPGTPGTPGTPEIIPDLEGDNPNIFPPPISPVPVPASMALLLGALGFGWGAQAVTGWRRGASQKA